MGRIKLAIGLILVFLVGALGGVLGGQVYHIYRMERLVSYETSLNRRTDLLRESLTRRLELTEEQKTNIDKILRDSQEKIAFVRMNYLPEIKNISDQSLELMKAELNPEQRERLEELHVKLQERRAKALLRRDRREDNGPPPGPFDPMRKRP
ncbi:MAG: hypothetical protein JW932_08545 [Deltaproteobacteria bacterium]|nr:hypothetical protein [Deltaproteobacteria bacterium]